MVLDSDVYDDALDGEPRSNYINKEGLKEIIEANKVIREVWSRDDITLRIAKKVDKLENLLGWYRYYCSVPGYSSTKMNIASMVVIFIRSLLTVDFVVSIRSSHTQDLGGHTTKSKMNIIRLTFSES